MSHPIRRLMNIDSLLLLAVLTLMVIGLLMIYGIGLSRESIDLFQFKKQVLAAVLGLSLIIGLVFIDYRMLRSLALVIYGSGVALLLSVLLFGRTIRGTRGWLVFGNLSFQPVEIAKVTLLIFLAAYVSRAIHKRLNWTSLIGSACATGVYVILVMLQPDFGSALVMVALWLVAMVFVGLPRRAWVVLVMGAIILSGLLWTVGLQPYQRDRLTSFLQPTVDVRGVGYNVTQARIAIGSGGFFGKGVGEGSQARLRFLPESSTDFLFSVIGEELGFAGITVVLGLFGLIIFRLVRLAWLSRDPFAQVLLIGMVALLTFHILVNVGMNLGVMPVTGIPLPFLSAAASSLLAVCLMMGIAESIAVQTSTRGDH